MLSMQLHATDPTTIPIWQLQSPLGHFVAAVDTSKL
jgi:hypothetical protein